MNLLHSTVCTHVRVNVVPAPILFTNPHYNTILFTNPHYNTESLNLTSIGVQTRARNSSCSISVLSSHNVKRKRREERREREEREILSLSLITVV